MWSKPDLLDRLAVLLVGTAALIAFANGLTMLVAPLAWYDWVGTVRATGPANGHFIRDIGLSYLVCAALLTYGAMNLPMRWGSALAGAAWLILHGGLHVWEVGTGLCAPGIFWSEAPGTLGPPLIALSGLGLQLGRQRVSSGPMPRAMFLPLADRMTHGLCPHLADIAAAPGQLAEKYQHFMPLSLHRHAASAVQINMARIAAVMAEDCGPCCLIAAHSALRDGIPREAINAALAGQPPAGEAAEAFAFAQAIALSLPEVDELGAAIEARHGRAVRTELTFTAALARTHPAFKRGLGYAQSCAARPPEV